jgi:hypothetical protein
MTHDSNSTEAVEVLDATGPSIFSWAMVVVLIIAGCLIANRIYYLTHFGLVYTDGDQTAFWYQAEDLAHGIFREPCLYGQNYNVPVESWGAVPLIWMGLPAYLAVPVVGAFLGVLPFLILAALAYGRGQRWGAAIVLLIPLALPIEYTVVSSLPRGFVNGLAVATGALACWMFYQSRKSFFLGAFFAVVGVTVNPNCAIVLLAAGVFALLMNYRLVDFYLFSLLGGIAALPVPMLIRLFYKYHPECDAYSPKVSMHFYWDLFKGSLFATDQPTLTLNRPELDLFFGHFIPILEQGWIILWVLGAMVVLLLLVLRFRAAFAFLLAAAFTIFSLGVERLHTVSDNVFYSGSRMFLAVPVLIAMGVVWFDGGLGDLWKRLRFLAVGMRVVLIGGFVTLACFSFFGHRELLASPSPLIPENSLPPINRVDELVSDTQSVTEACRKYHVELVLIGRSYATCMDQAGPVLGQGAFETLSPFFERRTYRIKEEQNEKRTRVILYEPSEYQTLLAHQANFHTTAISDSPEMLLIEVAGPGMSAMDIASDVGIPYREKF